MSTLKQVKKFHKKFGHPINNKPYLDLILFEFRIKLLKEELSELETARSDIEILDALLDLQVVLDGAFLALGFWKIKSKAFAEVHRSNMSKLGSDGKPIYRDDGKILKGPNYSPPNLQQFIDKLEKL